MAKDPAVLFFIDKWFLSTKEMKADCRGWYLNLILHQFDKKDLPNDIEELANLADVRHSEFDNFKQVFEQVLKHKFILNDSGRLENGFAREILKAREKFKDKRSNSGKLGYVLKYFRNNFKYDNGFEDFFKENCVIDFDIKNEQVLKQVFEQTVKLYINVIVNENINESKGGAGGMNLGLEENLTEIKNSFTIADTYMKNHGYSKQEWENVLEVFSKNCREKQMEMPLDELKFYLSNWHRVYKDQNKNGKREKNTKSVDDLHNASAAKSKY